MNISSITTGNLPGVSARPASAEAPSAELRQAHTAQISSAVAVQTEQSVAQPQKNEAGRQHVAEAVKHVNDFLKPINDAIQFNLDDETGKTIVQVIDLDTKDVIRQIPTEEMLSIAKAIDKLKGLLIQQKA